jgi:hypothetical protein
MNPLGKVGIGCLMPTSPLVTEKTLGMPTMPTVAYQ